MKTNMQPEMQKLQGERPNVPRKISLLGQLATAKIGSGSSLTVFVIPEGVIGCRKKGFGCKCLGGQR
jgi:hypothetical protein